MTQVPADYLSTTSSYNYEQPLPSVARTSTITQVPPAKKITFFKSGDPQFGGVKMAINQRSFKSFNALMDDLSHRVPLPFGVRTITTPRGIHCISELDQLEDGGCYLCSDKKYVKPISITSAGQRPGPPRNGRPSSTLRRAAQEGRLEDYSTPFTQHGPRIPKKITLLKNGEIGFRRSIILNRRNARSFKTLLDEISEILQFPVKKLYTVDGKKIDSMQALLHCPSVLVCVGREPFKPVPVENLRKHSAEKLPGLASRSNGNNINENNESKKISGADCIVFEGYSSLQRTDSYLQCSSLETKRLYGKVTSKKILMEQYQYSLFFMVQSVYFLTSSNQLTFLSFFLFFFKTPVNFGLKAKKSVIHPRSASSNRSMRFSLSSEKSYPNGLTTSPDNGAPFTNNYAHAKPGDLVHSLVNDDIEKRVHVNKDGSLSVEMKVRFRLLNDETLQWSTQIKKSNLMSQMPCEESGVEEDSGVDPINKMNPEASSEADDSLYPCDVDSYMSKLEESECEEAQCHSCGKKHQDYDIWKNPMHSSQREEPSVRSTWHKRSSCSSTSSRRRVVHKKMASVDSLHTTSSEEFSEHIVRESSSYSETIENRVAYRSIKKCTCRSDLSTGASNGDQQECTRTSTSNSQRPSSLGLASHSSCENNLDPQEVPEDQEDSKTNSQNGDENCFDVSSVKHMKEDAEEDESSRVGSILSRSSLQSRQSKKNICEETSSTGRSMSSSSLQKANEEDNTVCSTPANSRHSRSSNCSMPRAKSEQDDHSEDNVVVSSFSSESCPKKESQEAEVEQEKNEINEVSSVSPKTKPSQSVRDESSEGERYSAQGTLRSIASDGHSRRSDSDEIILCNASCSSRGSKKSKHSHTHLDAQSEMSVSSLESTQNRKNSLHADELRSCSRVSNYSKSSCEVKKKTMRELMSHNSGSFHSNISSANESEAIAVITEKKSSKSTTNGYSESSKGSKKRSQREENSKPSSLCSSVSSPNGKGGECHSKLNSETPSSRPGSTSESVCSKGDHLTDTGNKNGNPASVSSRLSSNSEVKDQCLLTQISQESDDRCSQSNISQSSTSRQRTTRNLHVKMSNSSQASVSETVSVCSMHCPAPPKGKPSSQKIRSATLKNSSVSSTGTESVLTMGKDQKEIVDSSKQTSLGSKSTAKEINDKKNKEVDYSFKEKVKEALEGMGTQEEESDLMPSTLPNTSPEEVVQEWLSKIPSETLLMKYEMEEAREEACIEATTEVSHRTNAEEISEEEKSGKKNVEEEENEPNDEVEKETAEASAINEEGELCLNQEQTSEVVSEPAKASQAECSQSVASSQNNIRRDLPTSIQTSVQIMKALLGSKHETKFDRSHSLPEVSPTMGRKLSDSAISLITCLASLQLLDEESEDPSDKSKRLNKPRYMELLNIFQALWFGCTAEKSGPSSGQEASDQAKASSGFKVPKSIDDDFTPMSSSGVDVSSGSSGSGEESTAGARDCTLLAQKTFESELAGQEETAETGTELTEAEEQDKEEEQSSRPSTACSKLKGEEKAQSTREDSLIQEAEDNKEDQCNNCENGQEEEGENENEENNKLAENGEQGAEAVNDDLPKENLQNAADQLATTNDANISDANSDTKLKADLEKQLVEESPNDPESHVEADTAVDTSLVQQNPMDPDPIWVLKLLKKIEKEFMTHYVSAMNEFKVRWNLQDNQQLDEMILELKEEVSKRIQKSIERELRKIKSRAGRKTPRPPCQPLKRESTLHIEQRRRRLQTMHEKSFFSDKNGTQSRLAGTSELSFDVDEELAFNAAFEASVSEQPSEEEYCPCDSCVRKKMVSKPTRNPVVATNAPVMKAFDLHQILKMKKDDDEEICESEAAQDNKAVSSNPLEEAAENGNANRENDEGELQPSEVEEEGNEEKESELNEMDESGLNEDAEEPEISGSQNCEMEDEVKDEETREEEVEEVEEEAKEEEEEAKEEEEETKEEEEEVKEEDEEAKEEEEEEEASEYGGHADGSAADDSVEGDASEGNEEAEQETRDDVEVLEEANPESESETCSLKEENNNEGGDKCEENDEEPTSNDHDQANEKYKDEGNSKASLGASKVRRNKNIKRSETLNKAAAFSCYSSIGNFSQQSQKGSDDEEEECKDNNNPTSDLPNGETQSDESSKPSKMYPDSEEEEEDKASSCTDPMGEEDQVDAESEDPKEDDHTDEVQASKKKEDSDEIDQDDLDF
ncbi:retinitis pigmentosa 1-like 1 protein [Struthio camelus]|uniref:retinitis pigmentosa 1-like 1 protein n=1 Tax=Struthio camelus TaxID=8801 RepID=UPI003603D95E